MTPFRPIAALRVGGQVDMHTLIVARSGIPGQAISLSTICRRHGIHSAFARAANATGSRRCGADYSPHVPATPRNPDATSNIAPSLFCSHAVMSCKHELCSGHPRNAEQAAMPILSIVDGDMPTLVGALPILLLIWLWARARCFPA